MSSQSSSSPKRLFKVPRYGQQARRPEQASILPASVSSSCPPTNAPFTLPHLTSPAGSSETETDSQSSTSSTFRNRAPPPSEPQEMPSEDSPTQDKKEPTTTDLLELSREELHAYMKSRDW